LKGLDHQSLSPRHRRELGVVKSQKQKTALLLIYDQEKINMAKKEKGIMYIPWRKRLLVWEERKVRPT
jgi:hypothetical protein